MSTVRDPDLQELLDAMTGGIAVHAEPGSAAGRALDRVRAALQVAGPRQEPKAAAERPPGHVYLADALAAASANGGYAAKVAAALAALDARITWYAREDLSPEQPELPSHHALATLIGPADRPGALELRDDVRVGVSLVAPHICYPDHHHPPEEFYLALTTGEWRQDRGPWFAPGPNGIVYNTPDILHGMRAADQPQLAVWCLPIP